MSWECVENEIVYFSMFIFVRACACAHLKTPPPPLPPQMSGIYQRNIFYLIWFDTVWLSLFRYKSPSVRRIIMTMYTLDVLCPCPCPPMRVLCVCSVWRGVGDFEMSTQKAQAIFLHPFIFLFIYMCSSIFFGVCECVFFSSPLFPSVGNTLSTFLCHMFYQRYHQFRKSELHKMRFQ